MKNQNFKRKVAFLLAGTMAMSAVPFNAALSALNPVAAEVAFANTVSTPVNPGQFATSFTAANLQWTAPAANVTLQLQQTHPLGTTGAVPNVFANSAFLYTNLLNFANPVGSELDGRDFGFLNNNVRHIHQGRWFTANINGDFRNHVRDVGAVVNLSYSLNLSNAAWHTEAFAALIGGQSDTTHPDYGQGLVDQSVANVFNAANNNASPGVRDLNFFNVQPSPNNMVGNVGVGTITHTIGGFTNHGARWTLLVHNSTSATLTIHDIGSIPEGGGFSLQFIPLYTLIRTTNNEGASLQASPMVTQGIVWGIGGGNQQTIVLTNPITEGVGLSAHEQIIHRNRLTFDLRLTENVQGQFTQANDGVIELVAPAGFSWATPQHLAENVTISTLRNLPADFGFSRPLNNNTVLRVHIGTAAGDVPGNQRLSYHANPATAGENERNSGIIPIGSPENETTAGRAARVSQSLETNHGFTINGAQITLEGLVLNYNNDPSGIREVNVTAQNATFRSASPVNDLRGAFGGTAEVAPNLSATATAHTTSNLADEHDIVLTNLTFGGTATATITNRITGITATGTVTVPGGAGSSPLQAVGAYSVVVTVLASGGVVAGTGAGWAGRANASSAPNGTIWRFDDRPNVLSASTIINVGTIADWAVQLEVINEDIPTLVNGRFLGQNMGEVNQDHHRAARVLVSERVPQSWHEERGLVLSLPEGVHVREAQIETITRGGRTSSNLFERYVEALEQTGPSANIGHFNLGVQHRTVEQVTINNNTITIGNLERLETGHIIEFYLDLDLSIEPGFTGDIDLQLGGRGVDNPDDTPYVVIANAINPITVVAETTNIRLGYQFLPVGNFSITENIAGALLTDQEVFVSITDHIFSELAVGPGFSWAVTEGDIEITQMRAPINVSGLMQGSGAPHIIFEIASASTVPSTVSFSNLQVRQVMVSPVSNVGYDILVWGPAVAQNANHLLVHQALDGSFTAATGAVLGTSAFLNLNADARLGYVNPRDLFHTLGYSAPFITIGAEGTPIVDQVVTFSEAGVVTVGGTAVSLDPAYWGSFEIVNGVSVLPARMAFSLFFPGSDPNDNVLFAWNSIESRFTIDGAGRNIQFQTANTEMIVGGYPRTILSGEGANAFATAPFVHPATNRLMIPVRAFAEALDLETSWDAATSTVTLTPRQ